MVDDGPISSWVAIVLCVLPCLGGIQPRWVLRQAYDDGSNCLSASNNSLIPVDDCNSTMTAVDVLWASRRHDLCQLTADHVATSAMATELIVRKHLTVAECEYESSAVTVDFQKCVSDEKVRQSVNFIV
jgi:hypothetical protein